MALIPKAIELAFAAHDGQTRDEGTPYVEHPLRVWESFKQHRPLGDTAIPHYEELGCIALLHDVLEDSDVTEAALRETFGPVVAAGVRLLTKPPVGAEGDKQARDAAYYAAIKAASPDLQLIKLLDRLDNLASLSACPDAAKRERYAAETEAVFVPWAEAIAPRVQRELRFLLDDLQRESARPSR